MAEDREGRKDQEIGSGETKSKPALISRPTVARPKVASPEPVAPAPAAPPPAAKVDNQTRSEDVLLKKMEANPYKRGE